MMHKTLTLLIAAMGALAFSGCEKGETSHEPMTVDKTAKAKAEVAGASSIKTMTVTHLAGLIEKDKNQVAILDANAAAVRSDYGVIPGATALSHYKNFDVKAELPNENSSGSSS